METEKKKVKNYEFKEPEPMVVEEPMTAYGNIALDLDETKRYTYVPII